MFQLSYPWFQSGGYSEIRQALPALEELPHKYNSIYIRIIQSAVSTGLDNKITCDGRVLPVEIKRSMKWALTLGIPTFNARRKELKVTFNSLPSVLKPLVMFLDVPSPYSLSHSRVERQHHR